MQSCKVSVIMPTYKGNENIIYSIESVLKQTYKNIELIVVDDNGRNSPEQKKTENLVSKYFSDSRFKYIIHEENKNGSSARNTGIKISSGSYISFLDDDDIFVDDKIEMQINYFKSLPDEYGLIYGGVREVYSDKYYKDILPIYVEDFMYEYLACKLFVCSSSIMIKRNVIDKIGLWDESFKRHQDMEFIVRVSSCFKVGFIKNISVIKKRLDRNLPRNGELVEKLRVHYLQKMKQFIDKYNYIQQQEIYFQNYIPVGKAYLKNGDIKHMIRVALISKKPMKMFGLFIRDSFKFFIKKVKI